MKKKVFTLLLLTIFFCTPAFAIEDSPQSLHCECHTHHHKATPVKIEENSILTIRDCISLGLQNSPIIKQKAYEFELAKSNVGIAKSIYFPEIALSGGYTHELNSNTSNFERRYRELPNIGVSLNKMVYDFGKTNAKIKMEEFIKIAAEYEFEDSVCGSVFQIKEHYYSFLREKALLKIAKANLEIQNKIVEEIKKLINSGIVQKSDLLRAKIQVSEAESNLLKAQKTFQDAKESLSNVLYLDVIPKYDIYETQSFEYLPAEIKSLGKLTKEEKHQVAKDDTVFQHPKYSNEEAVKIANNNSPDIKALEAVRNSMEQALIYSQKSNNPEINVGAGYGFVNTNNYTNNSLNVGVGVEFDVNFMEKKYEIEGANAQLKIADTELEMFRKNLQYIVRKALNSLDESYNNLPIAQEQMQLAAKNFDIIFENYKNKKQNYIDVLEAKNLYIDSLKKHVNSQYEYNKALIQLEMAMHEHLIDYHDDAEHAVEYHSGDENSILGKLIKCDKKHSHKEK